MVQTKKQRYPLFSLVEQWDDIGAKGSRAMFSRHPEHCEGSPKSGIEGDPSLRSG